MKKDKKDHVEHLLLRKLIFDDLTEAEQTLLSEELANSGRMRTYERLLASLPESVALANANNLEARPAIKQRLLRKLQEPGPVRLWRLFRFKIPVYQTAIAAVALLMMFVSVQRLLILGEAPAPNAVVESPLPLERPVTDSLQIMENIRMFERQKIGRNILEDSLLVRFIVTSVDLF